MDWSDRQKAITLLSLIVGSTFFWYLINNPYEQWTETANPILSLLVYYFGTQGIYIGFIGLFTYEIYKEDRSIESGLKGFVGAIMVTIGLDLTGVPFAFPSILNPSGGITLQPSLGTSPYGDYTIARWLAGPSGHVNIWIDLFVHVILPILLIVGALAIVRYKMFVDLVEHS